MKKKNTVMFLICKGLKKRSIPVMLGMFLILAGTFAAQANSLPEKDSVTFQNKQMLVEQVFDAITQQLKYDVFYSENELNVKNIVHMPRLKMGLAEILDFVLKKDFTYRLNNRIIVISPAQSSTSQGRKIRGLVTDENDSPLPGATVLVKGTRIGVSTNIKGMFTLVLSNDVKNAKLLFSFVGMETLEIPADSNFIHVKMNMNVNQMEEVIVRTGYENIEKRNLTSSVVTVKMEDLIEPIANTLDKMLQGKIPGMSVLQQSSTVGAAPKIRIRGSSSILGNREPIWVLDGIVLEDPVPLEVSDLNSMDKVNLIGNAISGLNPEDIDQIDVLKDASATALYGTKAANGVIMITTKRGKQGKPAVRYSLSTSFVQRPMVNKTHLMNSKERIEVSEEIYAKGLKFEDVNPTGTVGYEGLLTQMFNNQISYEKFTQKVKQLKEQNTDWYKHLFRNSLNHTHTLSVSGADKLVNYYFSIGYSNMRGAPTQEESERYNFTTNLDFKISDKFKMGFGLSLSDSKTQRPHSSIDLYKYAYSTSRAIAPYDENGDYSYYDVKPGFQNTPYITPNLVYNIFNELNSTGQSSTTLSGNSRLNAQCNIASYLSLNALVSYNVNTSSSESWTAENSYYVSNKRKLTYGYPVLPPKDKAKFGETCELPYGGILNNSNNKSISYSGRFSASFNKTFSDVHNFNLMTGLEIRSAKNTGGTSTVLGYLPDRGKNHVDTDPTIWTRYGRLLKESQPTLTDRKRNEMSYFASFSYCYDNRYILNANVRGDASNKLGQDKDARFLPIWSFSGRWNIADEKFMENVNWMENLNIHGSVGIQGNVTDAHNPNMIIQIDKLDEISQEYRSLLSSLPNRGLLWEKTRSINIGTDFSFLKGRLNAMAEYYAKKGKDQLVTAIIESTNGATSVTINNGNINNKGWEVSLAAVLIKTKNINWNVSLNTSKNYNKITNAGELNQLVVDNYLDGTLVRNGKAVNSFYSYRFGGLDKSGDPIFLGTKAKDEEGNILISNREEAIEQGLIYSGKREPDVTGGLATSLKINNFSINASFYMQFGSKVRLNKLFDESNRIPYPSLNMPDEFVNRWRKPGDEAHTNIPRLSDRVPTPTGVFKEGSNNVIGLNIYEMYNLSDLRVVSGNFVRCRSISLAYYFTPEVLQHVYMKNASLNLSVSNPFVFKSKDLKGQDPEQSTMGSGSIPPQPTYSLSLSVNF